MAYFSQAELENYMGIDIDASLATYITTLAAYAQQYIDEVCSSDIARRWFGDADTASTRYFDGNGSFRLYVDDLREITSLVASFTLGNGVTLVENEDFFAYPLNAVTDVKPIEWIELIQPNVNQNVNSRLAAIAGNNPYVFWEGQRNVAITGKWGYATTVPATIKIAAMRLAAAVVKDNIGDTDLKELTQESLGDYSASYAKVSEIADRIGIKDAISPYIRKKVNKSMGGMRVAS